MPRRGAVLGDAVDGVGAGLGAAIGVAACATAEAIGAMSRRPREEPLWRRITSSALLMALLGWLLGVVYGPGQKLLTAIICGTLLARSACAR